MPTSPDRPPQSSSEVAHLAEQTTLRNILGCLSSKTRAGESTALAIPDSINTRITVFLSEPTEIDSLSTKLGSITVEEVVQEHIADLTTSVPEDLGGGTWSGNKVMKTTAGNFYFISQVAGGLCMEKLGLLVDQDGRIAGYTANAHTDELGAVNESSVPRQLGPLGLPMVAEYETRALYERIAPLQPMPAIHQ